MSTGTAIRSALAFVSVLLLSLPADAQLFRAYLAPAGSDLNPCTLVAPCRLLPAALAAVANGGEIWMLDSANYNTATVSITKSVSILAVPGAVGSVVAAGGPAVSIAAPGLRVALRNLVIVPLAGGGGTDGVSMSGASTLFIEESLIANLPGKGVYVVGTGSVRIANTIVRNNGDCALFLQDGASGDVSGTKMLGNYCGVMAYPSTATTSSAVVSDSIVSGGSHGIVANTGAVGAVSRIFVTRSTIAGTSAAALDCETLLGVGPALITVSGSTITNNGQAWVQLGTGSVIKSLGNNHIQDNSASSVGVLTPVALQ